MTNKRLFRVRDTATNLYWTGQTSSGKTFRMTREGKSWTTRRGLENTIRWNVSPRYSGSPPIQLPETWVIEEYQVVVQPVGQHDLTEFNRHLQIQARLRGIDVGLGYFYEQMVNRGVANSIAGVIKVRPSGANKYASMDDIKEARTQLRLMGVKTRSYREFHGVFGLLNRSQALAARLTMNSEMFVDLEDLRSQV